MLYLDWGMWAFNKHYNSLMHTIMFESCSKGCMLRTTTEKTCVTMTLNYVLKNKDIVLGFNHLHNCVCVCGRGGRGEIIKPFLPLYNVKFMSSKFKWSFFDKDLYPCKSPWVKTIVLKLVILFIRSYSNHMLKNSYFVMWLWW